MDPQSVTQLALVMLTVAGFTVAITGWVHLRRAGKPQTDEAPDEAASSADQTDADQALPEEA